MTDYRATPKQWTQTEQWAAMGGGQEACILELRARVEALEANTRQWRTDHLRLANTCASMAPDRLQFFSDLLSEEANSKPTPNDRQIRSSLVERVSKAIIEHGDGEWYIAEARAAIREVAAWLREHQDGDLIAATVLEREAKR